MSWEIKEYTVNEIFLDSKNIRSPITSTFQDALLQDLFSNENALDLVKSIHHYGLFPDEFPIVVNERGKIIVIEGNRRLAALKAIDNSSRVPFFEGKIKALKVKKISKIKAVLAPSRAKALAHIANKHTINLRRPWAPLRQAYFYKSQIDNGKTIEQLKKEFPEQDIILFVRRLEMHHLAKSIEYDDETALKVFDERNFPITNLERMYDDTSVQNYLGISFKDNGHVEILSKRDPFLNAYKKIVSDVASGVIDSRKYNKEEDRKAYVNNLKKTYPIPRAKKAVDSSDFEEVKVDKPGLSKKVKAKKKEKGLIPSYVDFSLDSSPLKKLFVELRTIPIDSFPNAAHDLLRSFLECTLVFYLKTSGEYNEVAKNERHNPKLDEMLTFIGSDRCKSISDSNVKQVVEHIKSHYSQAYSLARLNMINHNENWISSTQDVQTAWSKIEQLMKYLLNPIVSEDNQKNSQ